MPPELTNVGIVGAGVMGSRAAQTIAAAGHRVSVYDPSPSARTALQSVAGIAVVASLEDVGRSADVVLMYLPEIDSASGRLQRLVLVPTGIRRFRVNHASVHDAGWLQETMTRIGRPFGTRLEMTAAGEFELRWEQRNE